MDTKRKKLSATELSLLDIIWKKGSATAREIFDETLKEKERGYQTVKTMLDRMVDKGYLERTRMGPVWVYKPTMTRTELLEAEIDRLADSVLETSLVPLFALLTRKEKLSRGEIEALRKLIEKHEGEL